jgi:hypothetical protein
LSISFLFDENPGVASVGSGGAAVGGTRSVPDRVGLRVSSLAQTDALAKLMIEKGLITREEFMQKIYEERATYQKLLKPTSH